ncbi:winged helix-turn-helix domain-containing protein [Natronobacterium gregoryi]|nr:winged helix-turn-helix domain-containing protein [Natronobacterium gregoryi]
MSDEQHGQRPRLAERPADPFKALGNETRLEILRVLYDRGQANGEPTTTVTPYSELRGAVGIEDKGNFNYHLRQLDDRFLERDDDGYRLTFAGFEIVKVIDLDAWRSHEPCGPTTIADDADESAPLTAVYEDSVVQIRRGDETLYAHAVRPAGAADRGLELPRLLEVAATLWRHTVEQFLAGICPYCQATVERSVTVNDEGDGDTSWTYTFDASCVECGPLGGSHVGVVPITHPGVISFCWARGVDVTERPAWELPFVDDTAVTAVAEDPVELRVDVELEGDRLAMFVDENATILDLQQEIGE